MSEDKKTSEGEKSSSEWQYKGDAWFEGIDVDPNVLDKFIRIMYIVGGIVVILIILEAAGIFKF